MKYIDIHSHLNFDIYQGDLDFVLRDMKDAEVGSIVVGVSAKTSKRAVEIAEENDSIYAVVGIHPVYVDEEVSFDREFYQSLVDRKKVIGVGEIGLDFFRLPEDGVGEYKENQIRVFREQVEFARDNNLPIMIHCREAYRETLDILREYEDLSVDFHFFAGDREILEEILSLGYYVSFTGVITFTKDYDELIENTPDDRIMSETDCPYVTPVPHRGERNEPKFVTEVVKRIGEIKGKNMSSQLLQNAKDFWRI
jgi:TatD DNase family protein